MAKTPAPRNAGSSRMRPDQSIGQAAPAMAPDLTWRSVGSSGLRQYGGWVREEFLWQLTGLQAARTYREMMDNSPTVGAIMFAIQQSMRQVAWRVEAPDASPDAAHRTDFLESCMDDMQGTWIDFISESLSMLGYGFAPHEVIFKRRQGEQQRKAGGEKVYSSNYSDGLVGWAKIPLRGQDTIQKWFFDQDGDITGLTQQPWFGGPIDIPIEKILLFRPQAWKGNPEGRALALETPIPTPDGWETMSDMRIGSRLYDENGRICYVTAIADWIDRPMFEIELSDGSVIRADENHEWSIKTGNDRNNNKCARILRTQDLFEMKYRSRTDPSLYLGETPVIEGFNSPVPLDPYLLGYWLGDGTHSSSTFSIHKDDFQNFATQVKIAGYNVRHNGDRSAHVSGGMKSLLHAMGLIKNKHIPQSYLRASEEQRLALLQGLMDSDGTSATGKDHASKFYNTNERLCDGVCELVRSLGGRPHRRMKERAGRSGGIVNGRHVISTKDIWEISFFLGKSVHRLPRKKEKQAIKKNQRVCGHFIKEIRRVESGPSRCIEVSSPSHMFLCGKSMTPTHNSILRNAWRPWWFSKRLEEQEAIALERMSGTPMMEVPNSLLEAAASGDPLAVAALNSYKDIVTGIKVDEQMGVIIPSDTYQNGDGTRSNVPMYKFSYAIPQGGRTAANFDPSIERYKLDIMTSVLADFLSLGHSSRGTQSLATTKVDLFLQATEGWVASNAAVLNDKAVKDLWTLNGWKGEERAVIAPDMPKRADLDSLGNFVNLLAGAGARLFPDDDLENYLRDVADLPELSEDHMMDLSHAADVQTKAGETDPPATEDLQKHLAGMLTRRMRKNGSLSQGNARKRARTKKGIR